MARHICASCGRTLSSMEFLRGKARRTDQGYYCDDCFSAMLSDDGAATTTTSDLEDDVDLLEAIEDSLPDQNIPEVEMGPIDPGAPTVSAPSPESGRPSDSTIESVAEELGSVDRRPPPPQPEPSSPDDATRVGSPAALLGKKPRRRPGDRKRPAPPPADRQSRSVHYVIAAVVTLALLGIAILVLYRG